MKILHLIKTQYGAKWAWYQINELIKLGVEVVVILPQENGGMAEEYKNIGVKVIGQNIDIVLSKPWNIFNKIRELRKIVEQEKPDIIHSHFVSTTYIMRLALGKNHTIPRIFQVPGPLHLESGPYGKIDKLLGGDKDYWIGSCQWTCDKYESMGIRKNRIFKSFYGTDIEKFKGKRTNKLRQELEIQDNEILVGMVCYMYPPKKYLGQKVGLKGHEDFIRAIKIVKEKIPKVKVVIVGNQWGGGKKYEEQLKRMSRDICGDSIVFTGYRSDISEIYADIDIVVHPSLSENLGGAAESLACSVATITSNVGGFPDIVKHLETGIIVPAKNSTKIAESIIYMINNKTHREQMTENGRKLVENVLDIKNTAKEVYDIYSMILNKI